MRLVAARPFTRPASLARLRSDRDFARTFERLASEMVAAGHLERPDVIIASLPPLEATEAAARLAHRVEATLVLDVREQWPEVERRQVPGPVFLRSLLATLLVGNLANRHAALLAASDGIAATTPTILTDFVGDKGDLPQHMCYVGGYVQEFGAPRRHLDPVPLSGAAPETAATRPPMCVWTVTDDDDLKAATATARGLAAAGVPVTMHVVRCEPGDQPNRAATVGGDGTLMVHDRLSRRDYVRLLTESDIGVVFTGAKTTATMPESLSDFAAAGLAVVHDLPDDLAAVVERHDAGVRAASGDVAMFVHGIASLAGDRRRLVDMQEAARRLALAAFDRERFYPRFADWLETLPG